MNKKLLLALPLVTLLAACASKPNGGSSAKDVFTEARKRVTSEEVKQQKRDSIHRFTHVMRYAFEYQDFVLEDGEWVSHSLPYTNYLYTRVSYNGTLMNPQVSLETLYSSTYVPGDFQLQFSVVKESNGYSFYSGGPGTTYLNDAEALYTKLYNSIFSFETSLLCSAHHLSILIDRTFDMPQAGLNYFRDVMSIEEAFPPEEPSACEFGIKIEMMNEKVYTSKNGTTYKIPMFGVHYFDYCVTSYSANFVVNKQTGSVTRTETSVFIDQQDLVIE